MLCLVARFNGEAIRFPLPRAEARIGSASDNDIYLPFPGVSRSHATVTPSAQGLMLRDAGSKNRLYVDDKRVDEVMLTPGRIVQVGRAALAIEDVSTSEVEIALTVPAERESPGDSATGADREELPTTQQALQFLREMELAGRKRIRSDLQNWMARARDVIGADTLVLFSIDGELQSIVAFAGDFPDSALMDAIAAAVGLDRKPAPSMVRVLMGRTVVTARTVGRGRIRCVAAISHESSEALESWQRDVFEFVARKTLEDETDFDTVAVAAGAALSIPEKMIVGESEAMKNLLAQIQATVRSTMDVLVWGETGTGKELFARMIHASGPTAAGPFVAINCAAIPSELLESELFGVHGRVATGVDPRPGLFLQADGGSVFLDEIGELAEPLQAKLLRVLQEREVLAVGAAAPRKIHVRVIASSNRNLFERTAVGHFRADLYYRLRGLQFHIPPLRERREDIPALVLAFVARASAEHEKRIQGVSRKALQLLMQHDWPGNVRELQSEVERAVLVCPRGGTLHSEHFGPVRWAVDRKLATPPPSEPASLPAAPAAPATLQARVDEVERAAIEEALAAARGNRSLAAKMLGITRNGLAMKMRRLGIQ